MIDLVDVSKVYPSGTKALNNINLHVDRGEFVFVVGSSGAGKSTFLKMLMREEVASSGKVIVDGVDLSKLKSSKIPYYRRKLGIVFQDFRLIPSKNVYENVAFAMHVIGAKQKDIARRVAYALTLVGLSSKAKSLPRELSGGEQQRVALARALVNQADIIIADEPTGNIDPEMSKDIVDLLNEININNGTTIIMVTHEVDLIKKYNKRIVTIKNGCIVSDTANPDIEILEEYEPDTSTQNSSGMSGFYIPVSENKAVDDFIKNYGKEETAESDEAEKKPDDDIYAAFFTKKDD